MLLTETNKTQPGGLGQHLNPSDSSEGSWLLEMCTQLRLHWRSELPRQAPLLRAEAFAAGEPSPR